MAWKNVDYWRTALLDLTVANGKHISLGQRIGNGSAADVYEAFLPSGTSVAVKVFSPAKGTYVSQDHFRHELRLWKRCSAKSENVVRLLAHYSLPRGVRCILMEKLDGDAYRLASIQRSRSLFAPAEKRDVFWGVLSGLRDMHAQGIVHRDIKPENIGIVRGGNSETRLLRAVLMDFGHAEDLRHRLRGSRNSDNARMPAFGTLGFHAPEVKAGGDYTPAADIFAAGVAFYEIWTCTSAAKRVRESTGCEALDAMLSDMQREDPLLRPAAADLLRHRFFLPESVK